MERLWDILNKLLDNFNLGRASIYTTTGLLIVMPLAMIVAMLLGKIQPDLGEQFHHDLTLVFKQPVYILLLSYVFSFPIIAAMYPIIQEVQEKPGKEIPENGSDRFNVNRHFSILNTGKTRDPLGWLISEYFRFVEAAVYLPISMCICLMLFMFYFFLAWFLVNDSYALILGWILLVVLVGYLYILNACWTPRVIEPTIRYYSRAKRNLILGLECRDRNDC